MSHVWTTKAKSLRQVCEVCGALVAHLATGTPYARHVAGKKHQEALAKRNVKPEKS